MTRFEDRPVHAALRTAGARRAFGSGDTEASGPHRNPATQSLSRAHVSVPEMPHVPAQQSVVQSAECRQR